MAVSAFFDDDRDCKSPNVNRDTHVPHLLPGGWGQPPAVVQRLHPVKHRVLFYCSRKFDKIHYYSIITSKIEKKTLKVKNNALYFSNIYTKKYNDVKNA